jgi:hypothetical protein
MHPSLITTAIPGREQSKEAQNRSIHLSYRRLAHLAGIEPATGRFTAEVTSLYTTAIPGFLKARNKIIPYPELLSIGF